MPSLVRHALNLITSAIDAAKKIRDVDRQIRDEIAKLDSQRIGYFSAWRRARRWYSSCATSITARVAAPGGSAPS